MIENTTVSLVCPCGRSVKRPKQRNCRLCHAEANRKLRAKIKREREMAKKVRNVVLTA